MMHGTIYMLVFNKWPRNIHLVKLLGVANLPIGKAQHLINKW